MNIMDRSAMDSEVRNLVETEMRKKHLQETVHELTGMCFDKCIKGTPGDRLNPNDKTCLANCVNRFIDTALVIVKKPHEG